jgi:hypothetical protein
MHTIDSLEIKTSAYAGVELRNVQQLLEVLAQSAHREASYVRQRFLEQGNHFDETLAFLERLGMVRVQATTVLLISASSKNGGTEATLAQELVHRLSQCKGQLRSELLSYLRHFRVSDNAVVQFPTPEERSEHVALRNLLMELSVVAHDRNTNGYALGLEHGHLYVAALRSASPVSPTRMTESLVADREIGERAERWVLEYEGTRVGTSFKGMVDHVAARDVAAGYDIESVTVMSEKQVVPRLIEVKVISGEDSRFYWTASEVAAALRFAS